MRTIPHPGHTDPTGASLGAHIYMFGANSDEQKTTTMSYVWFYLPLTATWVVAGRPTSIWSYV